MVKGKGPLKPAIQVKQAPDGSLIVSLRGGGELSFFPSGSLASVTIEAVRASPAGLGEDDWPALPKATLMIPAAKPDQESQPVWEQDDEPSIKPLVWIKSSQTPNAEHRKARPWLLEAEGLPVGLIPGNTYSVGRDESADLRVVEEAAKGDTVSRKHASLAVIGSGLSVIDEDSRNGTWVGDERLQARRARVLRKRTELMLGKFKLVVSPAPDDVPC